ncbi:MAG: outer membrane protein assembly factor BamD, partial [Bacteroidetes bacterium]
MKKLIYITVVIIAFSSCSEYQKALKSEDIAKKFQMGTDLYDAGKFNKANGLFVQIVPKYRGKPQAEKLMYMYSKTFYETRDYYTSNYQMERFVSAYPESEKVQEIAFLGAKSYYHLSPVYSKEQKETVDALNKLQEFINSYPDSEYLVEANALVKELDFKLEKKAYEIAKGYNKTGPYSRDYQAAISAFDNFIIDFPGTSFKEDAMFYRLDSAYKMAINSVEWKKEQRINDAITYYKSFKKA